MSNSNLKETKNKYMDKFGRPNPYTIEDDKLDLVKRNKDTLLGHWYWWDVINLDGSRFLDMHGIKLSARGKNQYEAMKNFNFHHPEYKQDLSRFEKFKYDGHSKEYKDAMEAPLNKNTN